MYVGDNSSTLLFISFIQCLVNVRERDSDSGTCRGGLKLEAAIEKLDVDVSEKVVLDSGLSTGGFTDCLLRYGAAHVYGVDVGYGQVLSLVPTESESSKQLLFITYYSVNCLMYW